jgi:gas vesicle structural protein
MAVKRMPNTWSLIDVFDRVLDKGIVIDGSARISLVGVDLVTVEARIVVASLATYLGYADGLAESNAQAPLPAWPGLARRTA